MSDYEWGTLAGDRDAKAIADGRRAQGVVVNWFGTAWAIADIAVAIWYGYTGKPGILAVLIILATGTVTAVLSGQLYEQLTVALITRARVTALEAELRAVTADLESGHLKVSPRPPPRDPNASPYDL